jgi:hypothetical protein
MAIKIKSAADIAAKYTEVTPGRSSQYEKGIKETSPGDFEAAAIAGEANYAAALQSSIASKRRAKKLQGKGSKWQAKAAELGPSRFATGTGAAASDYAEGFAPYQGVIAALTLPPKGPAGDPKNFERVRAIGTALHNKKVAAA